MKTIRCLILSLLWLGVIPLVSAATTYYVSDESGNDANNGAGWDTAFKTITNGLAWTSPGDTVLVSNGVYYSQQPLTDAGGYVAMIFLTNMATLKSVNGAAHTIIDGNYPAVTNRCIKMSGTGVVDGFTIRGGRADTPDAKRKGGGVYMTMAVGSIGGTVRCSIIESNFAGSGYGGIGVSSHTTGMRGVLIENCIIRNNSCLGPGGGVGIDGNVDNTIRNCLIIKNQCSPYTAVGGGGMAISRRVYVQNCTIVSNYTATHSSIGGGIYVSDAPLPAYITNTIIYYNRSDAGIDNCVGTNANYGYNCMYPLVAGSLGSVNETTNEPLFNSISDWDFQLQPNSPCINKGMNQDWMTNAVDLDGRTRLRYGAVDMGAYERINQGTIFFIGR